MDYYNCFANLKLAVSLCRCRAYADDLILLAPTARAMTSMIHVCDQYAIEYNMVFNACKSKCFVASRHKHPLVKSVKPAFYIGQKEIELQGAYVEE